jgi:DNA polymerase III epsilon subunit-like protein
MKKITIFDTETTGFFKTDEEIKNGEKQAEIIEIAGVTNYPKLKTWSEYIKPVKTDYDNLTDEEYQAMATTGITKERLAEKAIDYKKSLFFQELKTNNNKEHVLVAHNAKFDINMLRTIDDFKENFNFSVIDTLVVARDVLETSKHSLQFLRYKMGYYRDEEKMVKTILGENAELNAHEAISDVIFLTQLFNDLKGKVAQKYNIKDKEEIIDKMIDISTQVTLQSVLPMTDQKGETYFDEIKNKSWTVKWLYDKIEKEQNPELHFTTKLSMILTRAIQTNTINEYTYNSIMDFAKRNSREKESFKEEELREILEDVYPEQFREDILLEIELIVKEMKKEVSDLPWKKTMVLDVKKDNEEKKSLKSNKTPH